MASQVGMTYRSENPPSGSLGVPTTMNVASESDGRFSVLRGPKASFRFLQKLRESRLVHGRRAPANRVRFLCINIYRDDLKTARGKTSRYGCPEFAQTNN